MQFCHGKTQLSQIRFHVEKWENKSYIFESVRKKWLILTPENGYVNIVSNSLLKIKKFIGFIQVEKISFNNLVKGTT